jgi:hypothetical protein
MNLIRLGKRFINLDYMILAEEWDGQAEAPGFGPGAVRLTLESGRVLDLGPVEAEALLRRLGELVAEGPGAPGTAAVSVSPPLDPQTGRPLDRPPARRKKGG